MTAVSDSSFACCYYQVPLYGFHNYLEYIPFFHDHNCLCFYYLGFTLGITEASFRPN